MRPYKQHIAPLKKPVRAGLFFTLLFCCTFLSHAQTPSSANQVKAVFLFNFSQFVSWPPGAFSSANAPFIIGVLGTNPFGTYLESVVEGERVDGHPIIVKRYKNLIDVKNCQILFINKENPTEVLRDLDDRNILTVSDAPNFAREGGMICFNYENHKIRLQINDKAARAANLSISSKLLRLADVIDN